MRAKRPPEGQSYDTSQPLDQEDFCACCGGFCPHPLFLYLIAKYLYLFCAKNMNSKSEQKSIMNSASLHKLGGLREIMRGNQPGFTIENARNSYSASCLIY